MPGQRPDVALVVAWKESGGFEFGVVDTARAVTEYLRGLVDETEGEVDDLQPRRYSIEADLESDEYFSVSLEDRDEEVALRELVVNIDAMEQLASGDLPAKPLTFYAVVVGNRPERRTAYIRKTNPMKVAKPGWGLFEFGETLTTIANPIFVVENRFDLILRPDRIEIIRPTVFEALFYELTGVDTKIRGWVRTIARTLPMSDETLSRLSEACRNKPRLRRRLQAIEERGHLAEIGIEEFRRELRRLGYQPSRFISGGRITAQEHDYPVLLQILNEDIFRGGLTDEEFAAERKTRIHPT